MARLGNGLLDLRPAIVAYRRIVGLWSKYKFKFFGRDLGRRCSLGLPNNLFANRKISPLFLREVLGNQLATGTTEIVNAVGAILPYVDFLVRVSNFVDYHHGNRFTGLAISRLIR